LPNPQYQRITPFSRRVWLIIAGVLLLGHTTVLAESYIRVYKKGVIYYHYSIREHAQSKPANLKSPVLERQYPLASPKVMYPGSETLIRKVDQPYSLWPALISAVNRLEATGSRQVVSPEDAPDLTQLRLVRGHDPEAVNSGALQENIWTHPRYLGRLLGRFGYWSPPASATSDPDAWRADPQPHPPLQEARALIRNVSNKFLQYAQAQPPKILPGEPVVYRSVESNQLGYCFPVAQPYSFRDSWGDSRSGGRIHRAIDIVAFEGTPAYAITGGVIHRLSTSQDGGIMLYLRGQDSYGYAYMHLQGYAAGIEEGKPVRAGELIAYVGRTGILRDAPHLHLQVHGDHRFTRDEMLNPYGLLCQLSNGKGLTDFSPPQIARRRIPAAEIMNYGTVRLSDSGY
jgi:murein DD-endopeptidase MepM/ murein hydrolase activator NlpD